MVPANMWANANAAAQAYKAAGDTANAEKMQAIADKIQKEVTTELWDKSDNLLKHKWLNDGAFAKYKEINNYYPYSEGLMPTGNEDYNKALRLFEDSNEFPIFPFFTANQADKAALNFPRFQQLLHYQRTAAAAGLLGRYSQLRCSQERLHHQ